MTPGQYHKKYQAGALHGVAATEPEPAWVSYSYGQIPDQRTFQQQYFAVVGPGEAYTMELVGDDLAAMEGAYGPPHGVGAYGKAAYAFSWEDLYMVVQSLQEEAEQATYPEESEKYSSLASGILYTLNIEWI